MVKIGNELTKRFVIKEGVKQGGVISPFLFNYYINDLLINIDELNLGAKIGHKNVNIIAYSDDLILMSPVPEHMRRMLNECEQWRIKLQNGELSSTLRNPLFIVDLMMDKLLMKSLNFVIRSLNVMMSLFTLGYLLVITNT